jgi:ribosomal protein S18 acetylase RimI-like enzyme
MITETVTVVPAEAADRERCMAVLTAAFAADPLMRWMFPQASDYLTYFPRVLHHYAGGAFDRGSAYRTEDFAGSAMWLPPGAGPDEEALGAVLEAGVADDRRGEVFALLEEVAAAHPDEPHWFLPAIGVDPARQSRGVGAALMARSLERCDAERAVAYLESSNPRNVVFYERLGFTVIGRMQVADSPVLTAMRRPAG